MATVKCMAKMHNNDHSPVILRSILLEVWFFLVIAKFSVFLIYNIHAFYGTMRGEVSQLHTHAYICMQAHL